MKAVNGWSQSYREIKLLFPAGKWVVAKLQSDKSASPSSAELDDTWISGPLRNSWEEVPLRHWQCSVYLDAPICAQPTSLDNIHPMTRSEFLTEQLEWRHLFYRGAPKSSKNYKDYSKNISSGKEFPFKSGNKLLRTFFRCLLRKGVTIHAYLRGGQRATTNVQNGLVLFFLFSFKRP